MPESTLVQDSGSIGGIPPGGIVLGGLSEEASGMQQIQSVGQIATGPLLLIREAASSTVPSQLTIVEQVPTFPVVTPVQAIGAPKAIVGKSTQRPKNTMTPKRTLRDILIPIFIFYSTRQLTNCTGTREPEINCLNNYIPHERHDHANDRVLHSIFGLLGLTFIARSCEIEDT